ncbi:MAG: ABC transporter substrate-binding protein [Candidatus Bathyarchaeia archaeon]
MKKPLLLSKAAITKMQAIIIAVIIIIAAIAGIAYYFYSKPPVEKTEIVIGVVHSKTGVMQPQMIYHVYQMWLVNKTNAKGGLYVPEYGKRLPIRVIEYDDESNLERMLTLTKKLIIEDKVDLIFAPISTAFCFAAFSLYEQYHYPVIALTFGSDIAAEKMRTGEYKYCFSVLGMPSETGKEVADLLVHVNSTKTRISKIGILFHADQHGVEYAGAIYSNLAMKGFSIPVYQSYQPYTTDFTPMINSLKDANVDVAILCGYQEGSTFIKQCKTLNFNPKLIFTGPTIEVPFLVYGPFGFTKQDLIGVCYYDGWPATAYNTPTLQQWRQEHVQHFGYEPFPASAVFYAAIECLFQAVERVGLDREKIRNALATQEFDTIVGKTRLRPGYSMQCELAGTITQWQGGDIMEVVWPLSAKSADIVLRPGY